MDAKNLQRISDNELKTALKAANIPTLLLVICQITGDIGLLKNDEMPSRSVEGVSRMSPEYQEEIRTLAFNVLCEIRDGKRDLSALPDAKTLQKMLSVYVCEPVDAEYVPMFIEDMGFINSLETHTRWQQRPAAETLDDNGVVIIGAGISGICAAIHLKQAGIPFTIIEKNDSIGGTWYQNNYPACGVDTPNHFYSFSFEPNHNWSAYYSKRDEIFGYLKDVAQKHDLFKHIRFNTEVSEARYDEDHQNWTVSLKTADRKTEQLTVKFLMTAVGQLNRPKIPDFPGKDRFEGPSFHSGQWQHDCDLTDKRVAVIGSGASAMQLCPEVAKIASSLTILQRSKHWIRILPDYHQKVSEGKKWLLEHLPFYQNWYRFKLFWSYGDGVWDSLHLDPNWPHQDRSMNAENERHRNIYIKNLSDALDGDDALLEKIVPDYPPFAKRMLIDNHWCDMLKQENVSLENGGIREITPRSVIDDNGIEHEVDAIIYATGFYAGELLSPMKIVGRDNKQLDKVWGEDARAYLGMTTPDFPNFFMFYGPNTNLAHGGSLIFHVECQSRYITKCIMQMIEQGQSEIEVKPDIHDAYNDKVDKENSVLTWGHPKVGNWYKNSKGRVVANSPWRLVDYWTMTHEIDMDDYQLK